MLDMLPSMKLEIKSNYAWSLYSDLMGQTCELSIGLILENCQSLYSKGTVWRPVLIILGLDELTLIWRYTD